MSSRLAVRFRYEDMSHVMVVPSSLKQRAALALRSRFQWPALCKALGFSLRDAGQFFQVTGVGCEGTPLGSELVVHLS
jgi:hypothetical protein